MAGSTSVTNQDWLYWDDKCPVGERGREMGVFPRYSHTAWDTWVSSSLILLRLGQMSLPQNLVSQIPVKDLDSMSTALCVEGGIVCEGVYGGGGVWMCVRVRVCV